jgi:hypothetical protein
VHICVAQLDGDIVELVRVDQHWYFVLCSTIANTHALDSMFHPIDGGWHVPDLRIAYADEPGDDQTLLLFDRLIVAGLSPAHLPEVRRRLWYGERGEWYPVKVVAADGVPLSPGGRTLSRRAARSEDTIRIPRRRPDRHQDRWHPDQVRHWLRPDGP